VDIVTGKTGTFRDVFREKNYVPVVGKDSVIPKWALVGGLPKRCVGFAPDRGPVKRSDVHHFKN